MCVFLHRRFLEIYGEIYFRAWKLASGPYLKVSLYCLNVHWLAGTVYMYYVDKLHPLQHVAMVPLTSWILGGKFRLQVYSLSVLMAHHAFGVYVYVNLVVHVTMYILSIANWGALSSRSDVLCSTRSKARPALTVLLTEKGMQTLLCYCWRTYRTCSLHVYVHPHLTFVATWQSSIQNTCMQTTSPPLQHCNRKGETSLAHPPIYWSPAIDFKGLAFSGIHSNS